VTAKTNDSGIDRIDRALNASSVTAIKPTTLELYSTILTFIPMRQYYHSPCRFRCVFRRATYDECQWMSCTFRGRVQDSQWPATAGPVSVRTFTQPTVCTALHAWRSTSIRVLTTSAKPYPYSQVVIIPLQLAHPQQHSVKAKVSWYISNKHSLPPKSRKL
jgi:hypothetical protein